MIMNGVIKRVLGLCFGFVIFVLLCESLNFLYVYDDSYHRILFHSYYEQKTIDNLFMGSSHVYCDVNPHTMDVLTGENNFNMATPAQRWDDTYFLLKEVTDKYEIKNVYLECYSWNLTRSYDEDEDKEVDYINDPENYFRAWDLSYDMKPSICKYEILATSADKDHILETIFPFVRYRTNLFDWDKIQKNINIKKGENYMNYKHHEDRCDIDDWWFEYRDKGFMYSTRKLYDQEKLFEQNRIYKENPIGQLSEKYFRKSIELCKDKGINVCVFVSPMQDIQLISAINYDIYLDSLRDICSEYDLKVYDFNLLKDEYFDGDRNDYYLDIAHLNGEGAEVFTEVLWRVLCVENENVQDYFYSSYSEKLFSEEPAIYGLFYSEGEEKVRQYTIGSNRKMKYRIELISDNEATELIQDFCYKDSFYIKSDWHGVIKINGIYQGNKFSIDIDV